MAQLEDEGFEGDHEQKIAPVATPFGGKSLPNDFKFVVTVAQQKITICARDIANKRVFNGIFGVLQLVELGFFKTQTLPIVEKLILSAINGDKDVSATIGYISGEQTNDGLRKEYRKGDRLILWITHTHNNDFFPLNIKLPLSQSEQNDTSVLSMMVDELQSENQSLSQRLSQMERNYQTLMDRVETLQLEKANKGWVAQWRSSKNANDFFIWNKPMMDPPPHTIALVNNGCEFEIFQTGLYRISVNAHCKGTNSEGKLLLNGGELRRTHAFGKDTTWRDHSTTIYRRLFPNDRLSFRCTHPRTNELTNLFIIEYIADDTQYWRSVQTPGNGGQPFESVAKAPLITISVAMTDPKNNPIPNCAVIRAIQWLGDSHRRHITIGSVPTDLLAKQQTISLGDGVTEWCNEVKVYFSGKYNAIRGFIFAIHTRNGRRTVAFGNVSSISENESIVVKPPSPHCKLCGVFGRHGLIIDSIGFAFIRP